MSMIRSIPSVEPAELEIIVEAQDESQLLATGALSTFAFLTDLRRVDPVIERTITVRGASRSELMASWIDSALQLHEKERLYLCRFKVDSIGPDHAHGRAWGEKIDPSRHQLIRRPASLRLQWARVLDLHEGSRAHLTFHEDPDARIPFRAKTHTKDATDVRLDLQPVWR